MILLLRVVNKQFFKYAKIPSCYLQARDFLFVRTESSNDQNIVVLVNEPRIA